MSGITTTRPSLRAGGGWLLRAVPGLWPGFVVVALLACVLVPLPSKVVDLLLSASLAGAVLLVVASLRVQRTTDFLAFPSLLLALTIFRLALNVSTTRLILSRADAGRVIDAFAGFVVRGDFLVGAVVFAILTVIQYVVVARGAERVAEVGARFALDALPGQQSAIEADLRSGAITPREAAERRASLMERANFHGAMDGAIRFVRGDVVAGLVITAVNLLGGMWVGTMRRGLDVAGALDLYGRLTIGDGLLAQIPAMLVSVAAGILVARIDREAEGPRPAPFAWLDPAMLLVPAVLLLGLSAVPAMPKVAFVSTGLALGAVALWQARRVAEAERALPVRRPRRVRVVVPPALAAHAQTAEAVAAAAGRIEQDLGIPVPQVVCEPGGDEAVRVVFGSALLGEQPTVPGIDELVVFVYRSLSSHADRLLDVDAIDQLLAQVRRTRPVLLQEALAVLAAPDLAASLRAFARERVPLPPMEEALAAVVTLPQLRTPEAAGRAYGLLRRELAPTFVPALVGAFGRRGGVRYLRTHPDLDALLEARYRPGPGLGELALDLATRRRIRRAVAARAAEGPCILLAPEAVRNAAALATLDRSGPFVPAVAIEEMEEAGLPVPAGVQWLEPSDPEV